MVLLTLPPFEQGNEGQAALLCFIMADKAAQWGDCSDYANPNTKVGSLCQPYHWNRVNTDMKIAVRCEETSVIETIG